MSPAMERIVRALGHSPELGFTGRMLKDHEKGLGLGIYRDGRPVRFYAFRTLENLRRDPEWLEAHYRGLKGVMDPAESASLDALAELRDDVRAAGLRMTQDALETEGDLSPILSVLDKP